MSAVSQLFIELYLDEDVSVLVAELLRARGFVALTARETGQLGNSDEGQLGYAVSNQKVFLTHNRVDFERLAQHYFQTGKEHYGIIIAARSVTARGGRTPAGHLESSYGRRDAESDPLYLRTCSGDLQRRRALMRLKIESPAWNSALIALNAN